MNSMKRTHLKISLTGLAILAAAIFAPHTARAHCDGLDGPVVKAAQSALAAGNINLALIWVQKNDEPEIKRAFEKTLAVRKLDPEAKELADLYFFETLVRVHRAGEGAPYTGLKPAGRDLGPAIPAGDKALETGELEPLLDLLSAEMKHGLHERFSEALAKKKFARDDVEAGRAYVKAYVSYIHYVEGMHQAASGAVHDHPGEEPEHRPTVGEPTGEPKPGGSGPRGRVVDAGFRETKQP